MGRISQTLQSIILAIPLVCLRAYQYAISPLLGPHCRFYPSCSEYMYQSLQRFGWWRGSGLGIKRLLRCHPGCQGGVDFLPDDNVGIEKNDG